MGLREIWRLTPSQLAAIWAAQASMPVPLMAHAARYRAKRQGRPKRQHAPNRAIDGDGCCVVAPAQIGEAPPAGFEPTTFGFEIRRHSPLGHGGYEKLSA